MTRRPILRKGLHSPFADKPPESMRQRVTDSEVALERWGRTGINRAGRFLDEEYHPRLRGRRAMRAYRRMGDESAGLAAALLIMEAFLAQADWDMAAPKGSGQDGEALAQWFDGMRNDMRTSFVGHVAEVSSFVQYGFSIHEMLLKLRRGPEEVDLRLKSKYTDNLWGIADMSPIGQESVYGWQWDQEENLVGVYQLPPNLSGILEIPIDKVLHLAVRPRKGNPEGYSCFRGAYDAFRKRKLAEEFEMIGIERQLDGLPYATVPPEFLSPNADAAKKAVVAIYEEITQRVRRDTMEGLVLAAEETRQGKTGYSFGLLSSGNDVSKADVIIKRYRADEVIAVLMQFVILGSTDTGSWSLHDSATSITAKALGYFLRLIAEGWNNQVIPLICRLNRFPIQLAPQLTFKPIEDIDLDKVSRWITSMHGIGLWTNGPHDEAWVRARATAPEGSMDKDAGDPGAKTTVAPNPMAAPLNNLANALGLLGTK